MIAILVKLVVLRSIQPLLPDQARILVRQAVPHGADDGIVGVLTELPGRCERLEVVDGHAAYDRDERMAVRIMLKR